MRGAHGKGVDRRQVFLRYFNRAPVGRIGDGQALGLRLVERGERPAAGVAEQDDALVALCAQKRNAGAEVLDAALHRQRDVVAGEAGVERKDGAAALLQRREQVMAEEITARMDDDEDDFLAAALRGKTTVDRRF